MSVHGSRRSGRQFTPNWDEMTYIKDTFWEPHDCVMQLHVPQAEHISMSDSTLHLWQPQYADIPMPDPIMVGVKEVTTEDIELLSTKYNRLYNWMIEEDNDKEET